jgi:hypothetical protein
MTLRDGDRLKLSLACRVYQSPLCGDETKSFKRRTTTSKARRKEQTWKEECSGKEQSFGTARDDRIDPTMKGMA